jgi:hypothetical protein
MVRSWNALIWSIVAAALVLERPCYTSLKAHRCEKKEKKGLFGFVNPDLRTGLWRLLYAEIQL